MAQSPQPRGTLATLVRAPLMWLALGSAAFCTVHAASRPAPSDDERTIRVDAAFVEALGSDPQSAERALEAHVRQEVLVREARALGLDQDDLIVRRQLLRRMEAIDPPVAAAPPALGPDDEPALRFEHVFFSRSRRGQDARADAEHALEQATRDVPSADPFLHGARFDPIAPSRLDRLLGEGFAQRIAPLLLRDGWQGPVSSAYGEHLVRRLP